MPDGLTDDECRAIIEGLRDVKWIEKWNAARGVVEAARELVKRSPAGAEDPLLGPLASAVRCYDAL